MWRAGFIDFRLSRRSGTGFSRATAWAWFFFLVLFIVIVITNFSVRGMASGHGHHGGCPAHRGPRLPRLVGRGFLLVRQPQRFTFPWVPISGSTLMFVAWTMTVFGLDRLSLLGIHTRSVDPQVFFGHRFQELQRPRHGPGETSRRSFPTLAPWARCRRLDDSDVWCQPRADRRVQRALHWFQSPGNAATHRRSARRTGIA